MTTLGQPASVQDAAGAAVLTTLLDCLHIGAGLAGGANAITVARCRILATVTMPNPLQYSRYTPGWNPRERSIFRFATLPPVALSGVPLPVQANLLFGSNALFNMDRIVYGIMVEMDWDIGSIVDTAISGARLTEALAMLTDEGRASEARLLHAVGLVRLGLQGWATPLHITDGLAVDVRVSMTPAARRSRQGICEMLLLQFPLGSCKACPILSYFELPEFPAMAALSATYHRVFWQTVEGLAASPDVAKEDAQDLEDLWTYMKLIGVSLDSNGYPFRLLEVYMEHHVTKCSLREWASARIPPHASGCVPELLSLETDSEYESSISEYDVRGFGSPAV